MELALLFSALLLTGVFGDQIIEGPVHTAAEYGENDVTLDCTVHLSTDHMEWIYYPDDPGGDRIYDSYNDKIVDDLTEVFDIERSDPDGDGYETFTLIVKEMTKDLGGKYTCRLLPETHKSSTAELVAVSPMTCQPEPGVTTVDEGDYVVLYCAVEFQSTEGMAGPDLTWQGPDGSRPPEDDRKNDTFSGSLSNLTTSKEYDMVEMMCLLVFHEGESPPEYTRNCTTWIYINHAVSSIEFSPNPDDSSDGIVKVYTGEEVNCTADGRPDPVFTWILPGNIHVSGQTLITDETMKGTSEYTCQANNTFKGESRMAQRNIYIQVTDDLGTGGSTPNHMQHPLWLYTTTLLVTSALLLSSW